MLQPLLTLSETGRVGFGRDMGATSTMRDADEAGQAIKITQAARAECEHYLRDPMRKYKMWRKVSLSKACAISVISAVVYICCTSAHNKLLCCELLAQFAYFAFLLCIMRWLC